MDTIPFHQTTGFRAFTITYAVVGLSLALYFYLKRRKTEETYALIGKMFLIYLFPPAVYFFLKKTDTTADKN